MLTKVFFALSAATTLVNAVSVAPRQNPNAKPTTPPDNGSVWEFGGCVDNSQTGGDSVCKAWYGWRFTGGFSVVPNGQTEYGGTCSGNFNTAVWCQVAKPADDLPPGKCVRSCADRGNFVRVVDAERFVCMGPSDNQCSWYTNDGCTNLAPESKPADRLAWDVACPYNVYTSPSAAWCKAAYEQITNNKGIPKCDGDNAPPPSPDTYCTAPPNGPSYGGTGYKCLQDTISGGWVPVKLTADGNAACMSRNSRDCIWALPTDKSCCEKLVATSSPDTPYFSCGLIHESVWGETGYELPNSWCNQARNLLNPTQPTDSAKACALNGNKGECTYFKYNYIGSMAQQNCQNIGGGALAGTTAYSTTGGSECGQSMTQPWQYDCVIANPGLCSNPFNINLQWTRAVKGDNTCQYFSPNTEADIVFACSGVCGQSTADGTGYVATECRGQERWCRCFKRT